MRPDASPAFAAARSSPKRHRGGEQKAGGAIVDPAFGSLPLSDPQFGRRIDGALRGPLSRIIATAETISGQFDGPIRARSEEHTSELQSLMRTSYAVFCLKKIKNNKKKQKHIMRT